MYTFPSIVPKTNHRPFRSLSSRPGGPSRASIFATFSLAFPWRDRKLFRERKNTKPNWYLEYVHPKELQQKNHRENTPEKSWRPWTFMHMKCVLLTFMTCHKSCIPSLEKRFGHVYSVTSRNSSGQPRHYPPQGQNSFGTWEQDSHTLNAKRSFLSG